MLDELNVGRALSPSAVSHGLGRLRSQLNDPLFLTTPKGVVATERALALAEPVADILARVRRVMATAEPFDPLTSRRRFIIGSPDGSAILPLPMLLADLAAKGPGIDIGTRQPCPTPHSCGRGIRCSRNWTPGASISPRSPLVRCRRASSRDRTTPTNSSSLRARGIRSLQSPRSMPYCAANHVVVSGRADPASYTGEVLASLGRSRRVQLTVPLLVVALATIAKSDLIGSMPKRLVASLSDRFGLASAPLPFDHGRPSQVSLVVPRVALMDAGLAWLVGRIEQLVMETVVV